MVTRPLAPPADPGASGSALIFDSGINTEGTFGTIPLNGIEKGAHEMKRVSLVVNTNVGDAVLLVQWQPFGGATLRTFSSTTIAANTPTQYDVMILPGRTRITIVTITDPTTWEVSAELIDDRGLAA